MHIYIWTNKIGHVLAFDKLVPSGEEKTHPT